jgi:PBP1b-binding outer membrane lipoprotein LpoB
MHKGGAILFKKLFFIILFSFALIFNGCSSNEPNESNNPDQGNNEVSIEQYIKFFIPNEDASDFIIKEKLVEDINNLEEIISEQIIRIPKSYL